MPTLRSWVYGNRHAPTRQAALETLDRRLAATGTILKRKRFEYMFGPRRSALDDQQHADLQRAAINRWGLHLGTARVLRDALDGIIDGEWKRNAAPWKTPMLGPLLKHNLARLEVQRVVVTDTVNCSLMLDALNMERRVG